MATSDEILAGIAKAKKVFDELRDEDARFALDMAKAGVTIMPSPHLPKTGRPFVILTTPEIYARFRELVKEGTRDDDAR